tara:strand:- start:13881 stop:14921 length:1041 start_codon:yes stop_codon:yes gene_type:complete
MKFPFKSFKTYQTIIIHLLIWAFVFSLPYIFSLQWEDGRMPAAYARRIFILNVVMNFFWAGTFYLNTYIFIPGILFRKNILSYVVVNIALLIVILLINRLIFVWLQFDHPYSLSTALLHNAVPFTFFVLIAIAFKSVSDRLELEQKAKERESENLKTELAFLRSQISPHFLLNVLNSMVALIRLKSDKLEPTVLRLSSILQYMLYDTNDEKVLLRSEVDYLNSYIELQKMRFGDRLELHVDLALLEDWHVIEPMLLIPFVENAFKHGTGMLEKPIIDIKLQVKDNHLTFVIKNKFVPDDTAKDHARGIGLANVERRLDLLYGKNKNLRITNENGWYSVFLDLNLEP